MVKPQLQQTMVSIKGLSLAARFDGYFIHDLISGYTPKLVEPAADSTGDGKPALQHIVLKHDDPRWPALTVGAINPANKKVKLRTYDCALQVAARRLSGRKLDLDQKAYEKFFEKASKFLGTQGMVVSEETELPDRDQSKPKGAAVASGEDATWRKIVLGLLLIFGGLLLWLVLMNVSC